MKINYISNLPRDLRSGGFSAMNFAATSAIEKKYSLNYVGPINPNALLMQKVRSKLSEMVRLPRDFFFFSRQRLEIIAREYASRCSADAEIDFFHGFTPWILTAVDRPFVAWSDCVFKDYIEYFHRPGIFNAKDLARVEVAEAAWLAKAKMVVFSSKWAADRAQAHYGLDPRRISIVGIFGDLDPPTFDEYDSGEQFAFISTNFLAKGGAVVLEAFRRVRRLHPNATLIVVGDRGPQTAKEAGVTFIGFLHKERPDEHVKLRQVFSKSRAIVNATRSDTAPVLLVEAANFGCPVISSRRFAIPEIVENGKTGLLVEDALSVTELVNAMTWMLRNEDQYRSMRSAAWRRARDHHSKTHFENRLLDSIGSAAEGLTASTTRIKLRGMDN